MKNTKIVKRFLLIFCLIFSFNFNLMYAFGTEPNLNPPSNGTADQQNVETQNKPQNQPVTNKQNSYKKPVSIKNNYPQQSNVSNFNNSSQNSQQDSSSSQNNSNQEQTQQNTENKEENKKDKKESSKNTGEFLTTYPEKFKWTESEDNEDAENVEDKDSKPKDLPEAKDEEIVLPEVITASETKNESSVSLFAGIIAWSCILAGIGIILFVLFMNKKGGEFPVDSEKSKKKRSTNFSRKYYKGNF